MRERADVVAPRWRKVQRDLWQHKSRSLLAIAAIAIGILGAGSVLDTWSLVRDATRREYRASNPASATVVTERLDAAVVTGVRALPGIADVQVRGVAAATARVPEGLRPALVFAFDDFTAIRIGRVRPETGAWPPRDGEIVVEASSVEFAGVAVGESLFVQGSTGMQALPVVGIARDVGLAPGWMEHVVYGFATRATLDHLGAASTEELQIVVADPSLARESVRDLAAAARRRIEDAGYGVARVDVPVPGRHIHAAQMDSLLFTQGAFGVLTLLLSAVLVVNLIAAMLAGQVREIGVMKTLGARTAQVAGLYLAAAFVLGAAASVIAIPAAAIVGRKYAEFTAGLLNFDVRGFAIPMWVFAVQVGAGVLLPVAAAALPVVRGCRVTAAEALRDVGIDPSAGAGGQRSVRRLGGVSRPILLAVRNAFRRRQRMALTLAALATGGAVYIGALDLRSAIEGAVDRSFATNRYDLALRVTVARPPEYLEAAVRSVPGVVGAEAWGAARAAFVESDGRLGNTFAISAPPAASTMFAPSLRQGRRSTPADGNALIVNRRLLADEPRLACGDTLTLAVGGIRATWTIAGVADTGLSPVAYACRETLARIRSSDAVDRVVVAMAPDASPATQLDLVQRLRTSLAGQDIIVATSQLMESARQVMADHLLMVAGFLGVMGQLMIAVGALGLGSTMSLGVLERTREIGILRAIGAPHGAIVWMVQIEGLVVAVLSWAIALPLSIPMSLVLGWAFGRIMLPVPLNPVPEPLAVVRWLAVVLVVTVVACAWPAIRATRITAATALAYE